MAYEIGDWLELEGPAYWAEVVALSADGIWLLAVGESVDTSFEKIELGWAPFKPREGGTLVPHWVHHDAVFVDKDPTHFRNMVSVVTIKKGWLSYRRDDSKQFRISSWDDFCLEWSPLKHPTAWDAILED
jgi:hypothetical protein